jgi:hypothetical protein
MGSARRLLGPLLALAAGASWPQQLTVVDLHHRSAESLMTVLRPLVAPAKVTGSGAQLRVRASPSDLPRVVRVIEESDRPLKALAVALSDDPPSTTGDIRPDPQVPSPGGSVTLSTGHAMAPDPVGNGQILSTWPDRRSSRILEGDPLRISMPAPQSLWFGPHGGRGTARRPGTSASGAGNSGPTSTEVQGVVHFEAVSDLTARIWIAETTVAIELTPLGGLDAGGDRGSEPAIVYGRVGQWIALADSGVDARGGSGAPRSGLWIKVDVAPAAVESQ